MSSAPKCIEEFFFNKLVNSALFGEPKDGLLDSLKERVKTATDHQCDRAAEIIIRERKSGAFPSFPVCIDALERGASQPTFSASSGAGRDGPVTKDNYSERLVAFLKSGGRAWKLERSSEELWMQWRTYFSGLGMVKIVQMMDEPAREFWTTPGEVPSQFDPTYVAPLRLEYPTFAPDVPHEERIAVLKKFAALIADLENRDPAKKRHKMTAREILSLEELVEDFKSSPLTLSPEAMRAAGITPPINTKAERAA